MMQTVNYASFAPLRECRDWHIAAFTATHHFVAYWTNSGQTLARRLDSSAANDPTATLAVHCGNGFDAGFTPYQSTRLSRYNAVS
jgi:hypothetical protein